MHRVHDWIGRRDRDAVDLDAIAHRADGSAMPVKLTNLSGDGCRMEAEEDFRIGEKLNIAIPDMGRLQAQVRWALRGSAGAKFLSASD